MADPDRCRVCESELEAAIPDAAEFGLCADCKEIVRRLTVGSEDGGADDREDVIAFEPIDYDYTPDDEEIVYLQPRTQFYRVEIRDVEESADAADASVMLYLHPLPKSGPATPITDLKDEIGQAIAADEFFRVTIDTDAILEHEMWWQSALELAPGPDADGEESASADAEDRSATSSRIEGALEDVDETDATVDY